MSCMYALRPAFELQPQLPLPTNMYTLSPVNGSSFLASVQDKVNKILKVLIQISTLLHAIAFLLHTRICGPSGCESEPSHVATACIIY